MIVKFETIQIILIYICASNVFGVSETIYEAKPLAINTTVENEASANYYLPLISDVPSQNVYNSDRVIHIPIQTDKIGSEMKPSLLQIPLQNLKLLRSCKTSCYGTNGGNISSQDTQLLPIGVELPQSISSQIPIKTELESQISSISSENISPQKEFVPLKMPTKISNIELLPVLVKETKSNKIPVILNETSNCKTNLSMINLQQLNVPNVKPVNVINRIIPIQTETQYAPLKAIKIPTQTDDVHIISHKYTGSQMMIPIEELNKVHYKPQLGLEIQKIMPKTITKKVIQLKKIVPGISTYEPNITIERIKVVKTSESLWKHNCIIENIKQKTIQQPQASEARMMVVKPLKSITSLPEPQSEKITNIIQKPFPMKIRYPNISQTLLPSTLKPKLLVMKKPKIIYKKPQISLSTLKKKQKSIPLKQSLKAPSKQTPYAIYKNISQPLHISPKKQIVSTISPLRKKFNVIGEKKPAQTVKQPSMGIVKPISTSKASTVKPLLSKGIPQRKVENTTKISPSISKPIGIVPSPALKTVSIKKPPVEIKPVRILKNEPQYPKQVKSKQIISPYIATIKPLNIPVYRTKKPIEQTSVTISYVNISQPSRPYTIKPVISAQVPQKKPKIRPYVGQLPPKRPLNDQKAGPYLPKIYKNIAKPSKYSPSVIPNVYPSKKPLVVPTKPTKLKIIATIKPLKIPAVSTKYSFVTTIKPVSKKYIISKPKKISPNAPFDSAKKSVKPLIDKTKLITLSTTKKPISSPVTTTRVINIPSSPNTKPNLQLKTPINKIKFVNETKFIKPSLITTIKPKTTKFPFKKPILPMKQKANKPNFPTTSLIPTKKSSSKPFQKPIGLKYSNISYPIQSSTIRPLQSVKVPLERPQTSGQMKYLNTSPPMKLLSPSIISPILTTLMPMNIKKTPNISIPIEKTANKLPSVLRPSTRKLALLTTASSVLTRPTSKQMKKIQKQPQSIFTTTQPVIVKKPKVPYSKVTTKAKSQILPTPKSVTSKIVKLVTQATTKKPTYQKRKLGISTPSPNIFTSKPQSPIGISGKPIKVPVISKPLQPLPSNVSTKSILPTFRPVLQPMSSAVQFISPDQISQPILGTPISPIQNISQSMSSTPSPNERNISPSISLFPGSNFYPPLNIYNFYPYYRQPCLGNKIPIQENFVNTSYPYNPSFQPYPNQGVPLMKKLYPFKPGVPVLIDKAKTQIQNNLPYNARIPSFDSSKTAPTNYLPLPCQKPPFEYPYPNDKFWQKQGDYQFYPYPYPYAASLPQPCYRTVPSSCH